MLSKLLPFIYITALILFLAPVKTYFTNLEQQAAFTSPESNSQILSASADKSTNSYQLKANSYTILGFLPYWLLNQSEYLQYQHLTHLAYFGIEFDENSQLMTYLPDGSRELGYYRLQTSDTLSKVINKTKNTNIQPILVVKILNNQSIAAAVHPANRDQVIDDILQLISDHNFTGINIDFEYIKTPPRTIQQNFTGFIKKLRHELDVSCQMLDVICSLTVDIYADTGSKQSQRLWQLAELAPYIDHFIVMGYDFHRQSSPQAGPVSPIHGAPNKWDDDLMHSLSAITKLVPPQKVILGVPFYGYEWQTLTSQPNSATIKGSGRLATYTRVQDLLTECNLSPLEKGSSEHRGGVLNCLFGFDQDALSPYLIHYPDSSDKPYQIWYENSQSLQYKLQLIKDAGLAGLAVWALGYESPYPDLWQSINDNLNPIP